MYTYKLSAYFDTDAKVEMVNCLDAIKNSLRAHVPTVINKCIYSNKTTQELLRMTFMVSGVDHSDLNRDTVRA